MAKNFKITLSSDEVPKNWYNINADLPEPLPKPKNSEGHDQIAALEKAFTKAALEQEFSTERYIKIPNEVRELYMQMGRPSPLFRATRLEEKLNTPAKIYYKRDQNLTAPPVHFHLKTTTDRMHIGLDTHNSTNHLI